MKKHSKDVKIYVIIMYTQKKLKTQEDKICHIFTKQKGTCSTQIELDLDGDVVHNGKVYRGL